MTTTEPKTEPLAIEVPTSTVAKAAEAKAADRPAKKRLSIFGAAKRVWIVLVIAAVVAVAGFGVYRLRGFFGAEDQVSAGSGGIEDIKPFNPKHVIYEVFGSPGSVATIGYLDVDAQPQRVDDTPLPWVYTIATTQPAVAANMVAQGTGDSIGCRITVNGEVKDERTVNEVHAYTYCLVKSA